MLSIVARAVVAPLSLAPAAQLDHPDLFGASVASIGDLDGRGLPDIAIGDPAWRDSQRSSGQVWLVSTESGRFIRCIKPTSPRLGFGWTLANVGDVDGDGHSDLAIGTLRWDGRQPAATALVTVISCTDGRVLHEIEADAEGMWFGWYCFGAGPAVCGVGDWNHDGRADFAIGSPRHSDGTQDRGRVDIISGKDGATIHRLVGDEAHSGIGRALCAVADLDGDGCTELAASAVPGDDDAGSKVRTAPECMVRVYASSNGSTIATLRSEFPCRGFGMSLAAAGDLDGDGRGDLWIGEPFVSFFSTVARLPAIQAWSSAKWSRIRRVVRDGQSADADRFATALVALDDIDGDGKGDVLVTNPDFIGSMAFVLSSSGKTLRKFCVDAPHDASSIGVSAADAGDLDGDGSRDVVLGGVTWRAYLTGTVSTWSPKKGARICTFTRGSIGGTSK